MKKMKQYETPVQLIESGDNEVYVKREDLIPYSFGGNKARKGYLFFKDIDSGNYDVKCIIRKLCIKHWST